MIHSFFLLFLPPGVFPSRTFLRRGKKRPHTSLIVFYYSPPCRKSCCFSCRLHLHTRHTMHLRTSLLSPHSARQLSKHTAEACVIFVRCHASAGHENIIHKVVSVFGFLVHLQKLLPVALAQKELPTMKLIARLQLSTLSSTLFSSFCVLNRRACFVTVLLFQSQNHSHSHLSPNPPFCSFFAPVPNLCYHVFSARFILSSLST